MSKRSGKVVLWSAIVLSSCCAGVFVYNMATTPVRHSYGWDTFFQTLLAPTVGVVFLTLAIILTCAKKLREKDWD